MSLKGYKCRYMRMKQAILIAYQLSFFRKKNQCFKEDVFILFAYDKFNKWERHLTVPLFKKRIAQEPLVKGLQKQTLKFMNVLFTVRIYI